MREILFKAKRLDNNEWVYGNVFFADNGKCEICIGTPIVRITYDVDPETVCQYIGLTDTNGVKIFEGDIIDIPGTKRPGLPARVQYNTENCQFVISRNSYNPLWLDEYDAEKTFVVVGNIYDAYTHTDTITTHHNFGGTTS